MEHFYIYSFTLAVIPLLLGLLFIWFGKKLWDNATKKNEEYQQRYTGRTTLRVIKVEKNEWEDLQINILLEKNVLDIIIQKIQQM